MNQENNINWKGFGVFYYHNNILLRKNTFIKYAQHDTSNIFTVLMLNPGSAKPLNKNYKVNVLEEIQFDPTINWIKNWFEKAFLIANKEIKQEGCIINICNLFDIKNPDSYSAINSFKSINTETNITTSVIDKKSKFVWIAWGDIDIKSELYTVANNFINTLNKDKIKIIGKDESLKLNYNHPRYLNTKPKLRENLINVIASNL